MKKKMSTNFGYIRSIRRPNRTPQDELKVLNLQLWFVTKLGPLLI